ncbi:hypothetical protein [Providencia hangzhouensis]|uniref:hypothetical protein n=1 Tax=Providencia hangzhouensis TaxID=3031799 RepID=UPI0034DDAF46
MLTASAKLASIKDVTTLVSTIVATEMAVAERVNGNNKLKLPAVNANTIGVATPAKAIASTSKSKGFHHQFQNLLQLCFLFYQILKIYQQF